ncbi:MAG: UTP--glucose-1-phosphate uridylyltransferase GalU [Dehalococcoidales bacterium]|nr:UTP--glucose-1-phosphate uridylyltransferase GalU [Dehalococcoidales bacterium]
MKIRKAVIVAAGWGVRFLPITKTQPKEMLPLINKPLIQYSVEEIVDSGIEQVILVTSVGKRSIEDYFDRSAELECFLEQKGESGFLKEVRRLSSLVDICTVRQKEQLGLGHAVLSAKNAVGREPFAVLLPDDIIAGHSPALKEMIAVFERYDANVLAVERIAAQDTVKYGIIEPREIADRIYEVKSLVEKPEPEQAPSNLGIVGRYLLMPEIFDVLEKTPPGKKGEVQLTDGLQLLLKQQAIYACEFEGTRYDAGTPVGWLKTNIAFALRHPSIGPEIKEYLRQCLGEDEV